MHVHETEDLRLRITKGVEYRAGFEIHGGGQVDDKFHAHGPVMLVIALRQAELFVELPADRTHGAVAHDGERSADVHARHEALGWRALFVRPLIDQPHAYNAVALDQRARHGRRGPHLDGAGAHHLRAHPLHELAHREHQTVVLAEKGRDPRQVDRVVFKGQRPLERPD